jgi:protein-disulfide isomerase-like protein with CxxC motif
VRHLHRHVGRARQDLVEEGLRFGRAVRPLVADARAHVHDNRHAFAVGGGEHLGQAFHMRRLIELQVRIPEMELDAVLQARRARAALDFVERIVLQRRDAAKRDQASGNWAACAASSRSQDAPARIRSISRRGLPYM